MELGFGEWMMIMGPMVIIMLIMAWFIIRKMFPFSQKTIELNIEGNIQYNWRTYVVAGTFILTILLWVFGKKYLGINANTVAMLPIAVFAFTGVITADDLKEIESDGFDVEDEDITDVTGLNYYNRSKWSAMAGSPRSEYCNLLTVVSCLLVINWFLAKRCASPRVIGLPSGAEST